MKQSDFEWGKGQGHGTPPPAPESSMNMWPKLKLKTFEAKQSQR